MSIENKKITEGQVYFSIARIIEVATGKEDTSLNPKKKHLLNEGDKLTLETEGKVITILSERDTEKNGVGIFKIMSVEKKSA